MAIRLEQKLYHLMPFWQILKMSGIEAGIHFHIKFPSGRISKGIKLAVK